MQRKWRETTHVIVEDVKKNSTSLIKNRDNGDTFEDYYTLKNRDKHCPYFLGILPKSICCNIQQ